jgi:hypothetical protein
MKKLVILLMVFSIPVLLSFEVWQVFRFRHLKEEVLSMEEEQRQWLEENKKILANISLFSSPERIDKLAEETLGLSFLEPERVITVKLPRGKEY